MTCCFCGLEHQPTPDPELAATLDLQNRLLRKITDEGFAVIKLSCTDRETSKDQPL
jgi:hypothetical protein